MDMDAEHRFPLYISLSKPWPLYSVLFWEELLYKQVRTASSSHVFLRLGSLWNHYYLFYLTIGVYFDRTEGLSILHQDIEIMFLQQIFVGSSNSNSFYPNRCPIMIFSSSFFSFTTITTCDRNEAKMYSKLHNQLSIIRLTVNIGGNCEKWMTKNKYNLLHQGFCLYMYIKIKILRMAHWARDWPKPSFLFHGG